MRPSQLSVSLKQRLSALSLSPSSPSSPTSPNTVKHKRRNVFPSSWKRHGDTNSNGTEHGPYERERLQEVMSRLIFQAGVDFETRPMVVMAACALPDPHEMSYDLLLTRILSYLDLYVESDYTLVFLAAGGQHVPSWNWVWKVYRSQLSRKYRKNLKRMYVVHPSFFSKMLFSLAGAIISPKFFRKIQYCNTLSELARYVPLTQIDIPPEVYDENLKHESGISLPIYPLATHFGVPLDELMGAYGEKGGVPRVVRDCVTFLREYGMEEVGLFRRSPNSLTLNQVQAAYDRGHPVSLETYGDAHIAAVLLKKFFRDLPSPIFPEESYSAIRRCPPPSDEDGDLACISHIREYILPGLGSYSAVILLSYVLHLLHDVSLRSNVNKMDAYNLAIVFAPNLVKSSNPIRDVQMCAIPGGPSLWASDSNPALSHPKEMKTTVGMVLKCCIERYFEIFDEVQDRSEAIQPSKISNDEDDMEEILVMPVTSSPSAQKSRLPPSAWSSSTLSPDTATLPYRPRQSRHKRIASGGGTSHHEPVSPPAQSPSLVGLGVRSVATGGGPAPFPSISRSRSVISVEKDSGPVTAMGTRRGSIRLGSGTSKGTFGKSAGAAVEALSITASGFFAPPTKVRNGSGTESG
ncbi:RhoGAP-domain-containing protein [Ramaria rubella]|nr:RhoGAP-domain-containing protein [Ramaria rubella]